VRQVNRQGSEAVVAQMSIPSELESLIDSLCSV